MREKLPRASVRVGLSVAGYHGCALIIGIYLILHQFASFGTTEPLPFIVLLQLYAAVIWGAGGWLPALCIPANVQKRRWWLCVVLGIFQTPLALTADNIAFPAEHLLPATSDPFFIRVLGWAAFYSGASYLIYALGFALLLRVKTPKPPIEEIEELQERNSGI